MKGGQPQLFVNPLGDDGVDLKQAGGKPGDQEPEDEGAKEEEEEEQQELLLGSVFEWTRTWSKYAGALPDTRSVTRKGGRASPKWLQWYLLLSVGYYFGFQLIWTGFTLWTARHTQQHGEAHSYPRLEITVDGRNLTRGFQNQGDLDQDARGARCCDDSAEGDQANGEPVSFGKWSAKLEAGVITAMRFPLVGIPYGTNISTASLSLEMEGGALYWLPENADAKPLTVGIQLEAASASDLLRFMPHLCTSRALTAASVEWTLPRQEPHAIIQSPDIAVLVREVQNIHGWSEISPVTVVMTPLSGEGKRSFKALLGQFGVLVDNFYWLVTMGIMPVTMMLQMRSAPLFALVDRTVYTADKIDFSSTAASTGWKCGILFLFCFQLVFLLALTAMEASDGISAWGTSNYDTVVFKLLLSLGAPGYNLILAAWLSSFVLTCELTAAAIDAATDKLSEYEVGELDTTRCLHIISDIDRLADHLNDRWERAQVLLGAAAAYPPAYSYSYSRGIRDASISE